MPERDGLMDLAQASLADLKANAETIEAGLEQPIDRIGSVAWFLPEVSHALLGGLRTVFATAEHLSRSQGTRNLFVIYSFRGAPVDTAALTASLRKHFPDADFLVRVLRRGIDRVEDLPGAQIAVCTLWTTAYAMLRYNQTLRKFYFMQDYEPMFYAGGDLSMMIEQTYRFGYSCIANTPGVGARYLQYSRDMVSFLPGVDRDMFHPAPAREAAGAPYRIVFYGRPERARNGFFLCTDILTAVKARMGADVDILSAGADWDPADYGLAGTVTNLGLLGSLQEVADLYRSADMGLILMATPHPSYQPLEYLACGCVTATNINEANSWLLTPENSLQLEPIPDIAAERIRDCLEDPVRRADLVRQGLETVRGLDWDKALALIEARMLSTTRSLRRPG